jgi:hypothetical protein
LIKSFRLREAKLVSRLQRVGTPLDIEEQLTHPRSPLRSALLDSFLSPRAGPSTFILDQQDENETHMGLAQMRIRPGCPERDVVFISPALDAGNGGHAIWQRLLTHLCIQTAERGSFRIYAHLPMHSEELQVFKNVGFIEYGQVDIYQLDKTINRAAIETSLHLRPQQPSDGWGLQKLYTALTPRGVQNVEGLAQGQWDLTRQRWGEQGRRNGYVWEVNGELLGALHIRAGKQGYWVRTMLHPNALDQAEVLCQAALKLTLTKPDLPVYFAFRQYESGWRHTLPGLGFQPLTSQTLVVKPIAIRIREKSPAMIPTLEASPTEGAAPTMISRIDMSRPTPKNGTRKKHDYRILASIL